MQTVAMKVVRIKFYIGLQKEMIEFTIGLDIGWELQREINDDFKVFV